MEIAVLYFLTSFPMYSSVLFCTLAANRFALLSDKELQALLEDRHSYKTYKQNKQTHTHTQTTISFNLLKNIHIGTSIHNLFALNVNDHGFSPSLIKIDRYIIGEGGQYLVEVR